MQVRNALLSGFLPATLSAQNWCAPGATWNYATQASWGEGCYEHLYVGATLLGGVIGQNIFTASNFYYVDLGAVVYEPPHYYITTRWQDDIAWWWVPDLMDWDTLYNFGAVPGDKWLPPNFVGLCPPYEWIEVVDTGSVLVSGVSLHYLDIMQAGTEDTVYSRITERFGWEWEINIWPPCVGPPEIISGLISYSDDEISWTNPAWTEGCFGVVGLEEQSSSGIRLFPNPGNTQFTLDLPAGPHTITLFDATGRLVLQQRTTDTRPVVGTEVLPAGLYRISVSDECGMVTGAMWVKAD
jgi:hypothetical protein